jgi:predicted Zn-dependent protease
MSKKMKMGLGILAAVFLAAEPLMMLWQPLLPQGSYAGIATFVAIVRAGLVYYTTTEEEDADNN